MVLPILMLSACSLGSTIDTVGGWLGFSHGADTYSTPTFRVNQYVSVKLTLHLPGSLAGSSIKVGLICNGGTELDETLTATSSSLNGVQATTDFQPALPLGADCFINQELAGGIKVVQTLIQQGNGGSILADLTATS